MENNKVMSDEQRETLKMQITLYRYICDMLADTYYSLMLQPQMDLPLPEVKVENTSPPPEQQQEPLMLNSKKSRRKRWTPTPQQLEILNGIFEESGRSPPNKHKIKEITAVLSRHGKISETNVYTWFQNRRARMKRKMESNVGGLDDHINQQQMMMKMFQAEQLGSASTSYNSNGHNSTQVESISSVDNYVMRFLRE